MTHTKKIQALICWLIIIPICILENSCKTVLAVKKMNSKKATTVKWDNKKKTVVFIDMAHVGKPEFYDNVKTVIDSLKKKGFIVYYEKISRQFPSDSNITRTYNWLKESQYHHYYEHSKNKDSIANDIYVKKWRKMIGFVLDTTGYVGYLHEKNLFKSLISQPTYPRLGIDETDLRIDVSLPDLVEEYEKRFDTIRLTSYDFTTPVEPGFDYPHSLKEPKKNVNTIVIDFRNYYLANYIQTSVHTNIVVVYGLAHREGAFKELVKIDKGWKKNK